MTARLTGMMDSHGTVRSGPPVIWSILSARHLAYNAIGVVYLLAGGVLAYRLGMLVWYLSLVALLSALGVGLIIIVDRRVSGDWAWSDRSHLSGGQGLRDAWRRDADRSQTAIQTAPQTGRRTALRTGE